MSEDALASLQAIPAERARLDEHELDLIDRARRAGATWQDIASALGLASRQAAEQRRLRLSTSTTRARQRQLDKHDGPDIGELRAAAAELDRRIGADRRWDRRFRRAALVRSTLEAARRAPAGALFSLVDSAAIDLRATTAPLPGPTRTAVERLLAALAAATPHG